MTMSFDDPKPVIEKRKQQQIFLRPSLKDEIDRIRGNQTPRGDLDKPRRRR